jgi:predicted ferric reductase
VRDAERVTSTSAPGIGSVRAPERAAGSISPAIRRRVLTTVIWIGLAVPLAFWWRQTPPSAAIGTPALLLAAGRLAGLIGGYLLLVQVLLMSRVPAIDRAVSGDRKSRWHRSLGAYVIGIITTHIVLITFGYAATAQTGVWHEAWTLLTTNQDMISALVAFAIMVTLAVIAVRAVRTRMPYGLWHAAHSGTYLILLFVYGHQFANGQQFVLSRAARVYWAALYVLVVAALGYGRVLAPLILNLRHDLRVDRVVPETPGVTSIYLTGKRLGRFPAAAGQYVRWRFLAGRDGWRSHPFSLSAAPNDAHLRLTVKASGDFSARLSKIAVGTRVLAEAPAGEFTADHRVRETAALIAAGVGITPIRAILETLPPGSIVVFRAGTEDDFTFRAELDRLATARRASVHYLPGHRAEHPGLVTPEGLVALVPDLAARDVYVCGPREFAADVTRALVFARVPLRQIHQDGFEL